MTLHAPPPLRFLAYFAGLLVLFGCATPVPPSDSDILRDALPDGTAIPAAWSTSGAPTSAISGGWVSQFRDPTLTNLVREALQNNRDMAVAVARVEAAMQTIVISGAAQFPQVGLGGQAQRSEIRDTDGRIDFDRSSLVRGGAVAAVWELDIWGRLRSNRAATVARADSIADDALYMQRSIAATVARSWVMNIELARLAAVSRDATAVYEDLLTITDEKEAAGVVSDFDVVQVRSRLSAAKATTSNIQSDQNDAIGSLEVLLGRYPALNLKPASGFPRMPGALPASGLPLSLLDRRPDISAARNKVKAAFFDVKVAQLTRLPSISLSAAGGTLVDPNLSLLGTNPEFFRIGASLLQPIFTGGALAADVNRMSAKQSAAVAEYGQTVLEAYKEVEEALANEKVLRAELANWQASLKDSTQALELANDRYVQGTIDMTGLLVLQQFQLERRVSVIQAEAALLTNRILLYTALGESI